MKGSISDKQVVVAAGPTAQVEVGDWVVINVDMFPRSKEPGKHDVGSVVTILPPLEKIGSTQYLFLNDRHIKYTLEKPE